MISFSIRIISTCLFFTLVLSACNYTNGIEPIPGFCSGPTERVWERNKNINIFNRGCSIEQVPFYPNSNYSDPRCGSCIPGLSGFEDVSKACALNEYCDDSAQCQKLIYHPLYLADCNVEPSLVDSLGICGPLRCYERKCLSCIVGLVDLSDYKVCWMDGWTYDYLLYGIFGDFSAILMLVLVIAVAAGCLGVGIIMVFK